MKYQTRRQLSLVLENEPGVLARACEDLAREGISIEAISLIDNVEQGVVRILTSDTDRTIALLRSRGIHAIQAEILEVLLESGPGMLARVSRALAAAEVNIEYVYGSDSPQGPTMRLCLKVSSVPRAVKALEGLHPA
ncbi:MAG: amino acid-binding protein [Puniceicoccaceae bacterium]|nr:MAG: amino acid-binding protein [Puniceicoccaceae bacterium]